MMMMMMMVVTMMMMLMLMMAMMMNMMLMMIMRTMMMVVVMTMKTMVMVVAGLLFFFKQTNVGRYREYGSRSLLRWKPIAGIRQHLRRLEAVDRIWLEARICFLAGSPRLRFGWKPVPLGI